MKVQFILAACVIMMIGTLIFMYQAARPLSVAEDPQRGSEEARHSVTGARY